MKDRFQIIKIGDIGVVEENVVKFTTDTKTHNVVVLSVKYFEIHTECYKYGGKVQLRSEILGQCTRCEAVQKLERCEKTSAKLDVKCEEGIQMLTVFTCD